MIMTLTETFPTSVAGWTRFSSVVFSSNELIGITPSSFHNTSASLILNSSNSNSDSAMLPQNDVDTMTLIGDNEDDLGETSSSSLPPFSPSFATTSSVFLSESHGGTLWKNNFSFEMESSGAYTNTTFQDNSSGMPELPIDMQFNEGHRLAIIVYSLLMIFSSIGNVSVLSAIIKLRIKGRLSRINLFLLHLAIADLLVTFIMMPLEITWNATVSWRAGDTMCRVMSFFRIFGLFLSGFILICISLDRYFAVLKPLTMPEANSRGRQMLVVAWLASVLCSLPQSLIFHVETHPTFTHYEQCVTFNSFPSPEYELAYNFFGFCFLYGLPLIMIVFCYSRILYEIYRVNALKRNEDELRRSNMGALGRAKIRTLKLSITLFCAFFFTWTPYQIMALWYWFDKKSALEVDQRIQKGLFLFACTNSCVNPLIYGLFHFRPRKNRGSTTMPRSLPNGYHRPAMPRYAYFPFTSSQDVKMLHNDLPYSARGSQKSHNKFHF